MVMHSLRRRVLSWGIAAIIVASGLASGSAPAAAADYGPDSCLNGWVWRDAIDGDHVCVSGETRDQAALDNALAEERRDPDSGSGECLFGYVWREVVSSDHVCVTWETRLQVLDDNARAADRRASLDIRISTWTRPPPPPCTASVCVDPPLSGPQYQVNGDHFNAGGAVLIVFRKPDGSTFTTGSTTARQAPDRVDGNFSWRSDVGVCPADVPGAIVVTVQAFDAVSERWSPEVGVTVCFTI
jgi:hypothetical protein